MQVQGSPARKPNPIHLFNGDPSHPEALIERLAKLRAPHPEARSESRKTKPEKRSRWSISNLLIGQCPEFLTSFGR